MTEPDTTSQSRLHRLFRVVALIGFGSLVILATLTMTDAVLRTLALPRVPGFEDISQMLIAALIATGFPIALFRDQHIRIDLLGRLASARTRRRIEGWAACVVLAVFTLITLTLLAMTWDLHINQRVTSTLRLPLAPGWLLASLLIGLSIPAQLAVIIRLWQQRD